MSEEAKQKITREVRWVFSKAESRLLGLQMARDAQVVYEARAQKIAVAADFTAQIKAAEKRVADLAMKLNNGYEMREVPCDVLYGQPRAGWKTIVRADNQELVEEVAMTDAEMQESFAFSAEGEAGAEKPQ